jgi:methylase of polypeptide subunit release factors
VKPPKNDPFRRWYGELESRHRKDLNFAEIRRALQALSTVYVERRENLTRGSALDSSGKRAAFALFYGPLHFLAVRHVIEQLRPRKPYPRRIIDLGCGSGAGGAAWVTALRGKTEIHGYDLHPWAVKEAGWTYAAFGLIHSANRRDASRTPMPGKKDGLLASWVINELRPDARDRLLPRLTESAAKGAEILIVEPVARRPTRWWTGWTDHFLGVGGRADCWEFHPEMPESLLLMDRAAKLDHRRFRFRTLSVNIGA